ncbi:Toxin HigB / Protein kinase domain of HipA [hydrothermal vent metagenome]|uniref:Toxin HigB / Protein kinase domain of HipA n=1 Tax=hydrothermal vent metagenome TaxID=652676 RepID=A0A3B0WRL2_9ZZZZ
MMSGSRFPELNLYFLEQKVGTIIFENERQCYLVYDGEWIHHGFVISPHLTFNTAIDSVATSRFIQNLFPEGSAFECLIELQNLSKYNLYAILKTIGHDTAGALSFLKTEPNSETVLRLVTQKELIERLKDGSRKNLAFWDGKFRLSVAGVQNKLNVFCDETGQFFLADGGYASTHILKFSSTRFPNIVLNEFFSMRFAKAVSLPAAQVDLISIGHFRALKVKRFDRKRAKNTVQKRHMIDGCQALNLPPESKYEQNFGSSKDVANIREGVSLSKLFEFANRTSVPAQTKQHLLDWILFNLIVGNSDAHGKNISFYIGKNGISLAPFYDIVSVVFEHQENSDIDINLAMAIDDNFDINQIRVYDLISLAETIGFNFSLLKRRLERMLKTCTEQLERLRFEQLSRDEENCLEQYKFLIRERISYFVSELEQFDDVYASNFYSK